MSRRARISVCGYYHVYNRGVAKNKIFLSDLDKEKFLEILAEVSRDYKFNIHSFCLMDNHYHLLLENKKENLSDGMRQLNSKYAKYFNIKYDRIGHFWQDRFKSWYIMRDKYLFTLFKYIETKPLRAGMSKKVGEYKYCAIYSILRDAIPFFLRNSFVLRDYHTIELFKMLNTPLSSDELESIKELKKTKYKIKDNQILKQRTKIDDYFVQVVNKLERNKAILQAFNDDFTKSEIARKLDMSVAGISKIIRKFED